MRCDKIILSYRSENDDFMYVHSVALPPEETIRETHHDHFELCRFFSGDVLFYIEGREYSVNKGDLLFMNSHELHRLKVVSPVPYKRIVIHFNKRYLSVFQMEDYSILNFLTNRKPGCDNKIEGERKELGLVYSCFKRIENYIKGDLPERSLMIKILFIELLVALNMIYQEKPHILASPVRYNRRITAIMDHINKNLDQRLTLGNLEQEFNMNKYHLCHLFKKNTGFTIFEYISSKRVIKVKELLLQGLPVIESCYQAGFTDYAYFYKVFKRMTGTTPKKFAKTCL